MQAGRRKMRMSTVVDACGGVTEADRSSENVYCSRQPKSDLK